MKQFIRHSLLLNCIFAVLILGTGVSVFADDEDAADLESFLESQTQEEPADPALQTVLQTAGTFGAATDKTAYSVGEMDNGPAFGMDHDKLAAMTYDSGYMRSGMDQHLGERVVANPDVLRLFNNFASLRQESGINLPHQFANLVKFTEQYIQANALAGAEASNGFSHRSLALQVVRASFCFGNDPFMILAKMRRETNFSRTSVSPTGAVGFSQMTSIAVKEVQDQLSGNPRASAPGAKSAFQQAIRCFTGINNYELPSGSTDVLKTRVSQKWGLDMVMGQILVKTLVSSARASQGYGTNAGGVVAAYEDAFASYNGDSQLTEGICLKKASVRMHDEYACDVISQFNRLSAQWNRFVLRASGRDLT